MKIAPLFLTTALICVSLSSCEGKMQKMSNQELSEKRSQCLINNPTSPGRVTACENIRKECEARRKAGTFYGCP
ncbi:MAG: hypothetical protein KTR16_15370 [Acidiferrobacterales bacterium]|nr:hypothetical protein [Acidiferrobacterales bacterium]